MNTKEREEFLRWHQELTEAEYVFNFETEIEEYSCSDADILRRCCLQFKQLMEEGDRILHALNGGEQHIGNSYVDGYDPAKKTSYEFMGCLWHGCRKCYLPDTVNAVNDTSMKGG